MTRMWMKNNTYFRWSSNGFYENKPAQKSKISHSCDILRRSNTKKRHRGVQAGRRGEEREVTHGGRSSVDSNTAETARENNTNMIRVGQVSYVRAFAETKKLLTQQRITHKHNRTHTPRENTRC